MQNFGLFFTNRAEQEETSIILSPLLDQNSRFLGFGFESLITINPEF